MAGFFFDYGGRTIQFTCSNPKCAAVVELTPPANMCPWCLTEIKTHGTFVERHFLQYHKTDKYGPPGSSAGSFGIETNNSVEGVHGCTVWLISGEGTPKQYFLDCFFTVDRTGSIADSDSDFDNYAAGRNGTKVKPHIPVTNLPWFQELKRSLADFAAGFSMIGNGTAEKLMKLVEEQQAKKKARKK